MNENVKFRTTIEYRPRSFDSKKSISSHPIASAGIFSQLEAWTGHNDQICIKKIWERKVFDHGIERIEEKEELISTGINKEMLDKFNKGELSGEDSNEVIKVLSEATDQNLSNLNEKQIQDLGKLILTSLTNSIL